MEIWMDKRNDVSFVFVYGHKIDFVKMIADWARSQGEEDIACKLLSAENVCLSANLTGRNASFTLICQEE